MITAQRDAGVGHRLLERFWDARRQSDALFAVVKPEAIYDRPIPERHRIIFYVGHLEAFDWNLLHENAFGLKSFHPKFDRVFAFGIDPVGGGLPSDQPSDWPSLTAVREYVRNIRSALDEKLDDRMSADLEPGTEARDGFSLETLLNVAIEHRLMHVETLAYMLHQLPVDRKIPQPRQAVVARLRKSLILRSRFRMVQRLWVSPAIPRHSDGITNLNRIGSMYLPLKSTVT